MEVPENRKYNRLYPGNEVRIKSAYIIRCTGCEKDENGNVIRVLAEYDPETRGGSTPDGRKVRGTIHWVDAETAKPATIRLYDNLFSDPEPDLAGKDFLTCLNPHSLEILDNCWVEHSLEQAKPEQKFQFLRIGYFCLDAKDSSADKLVFNRSVSLKDGFKK